MGMDKHQAHDLKQMQSLPLEAKIIMTQHRIRQWYDYWDGQVYVSFSGGKDSTVLKHIVDNMTGIEDVPAVFVNTGLEYPEIQKFVKDIKSGKYPCFNPNVEIIRPEMRFDEVVKHYGYPVVSKEVSKRIVEYNNAKLKGTIEKSRAYQEFNGLLVGKNGTSMFNKKKWSFLLDADFSCSHKCCDVMKKSPAKSYEKQTGRKAIIGTLADESLARKTAWLKSGCNAFDSTRPTSKPLSFWTEQDILHYIKKFNVPYASIYGDIQVKQSEETEKGQINMIDYLECYESEDTLETTGVDRTGCIFCAFGCHADREPNRFQRLKETHQRQYEYCIGGGEMVDGKWQPNKEGLGLGHVLDYIGVKYD